MGFVDVPVVETVEQVIEVPQVQVVEGTTVTESVSMPAVKQATMGTTRQERVVGPDLEPVIYQQAPVQQTPSYVAPPTTMMAAPTTSYVQPTTAYAAPTTSYVQPTTAYAAPTTVAAPVMTAPATVVGGSVSVPVTTTAPGGYIA